MYISGKQFIFITLLFLLLPLSSNWKLLLFGERTTGIVEQHKITSPMFNNSERYSIIRFQANGNDILIYGPEDLVYPIGKKIKIIYQKKDPSNYVMLTIAGLLLTNKSIIFLVLFILWLAFYLSVKEAYNKRSHKKPHSKFRKVLERKNRR